MLLEQFIQRLMDSVSVLPQTQHLMIIQFSHSQYYLANQPQLELLALVSIHLGSDSAVVIEGSIFPFSQKRSTQLQLLSDDSNNRDALREYCRNHSLPWLVLSDPWLLAPIFIPKPWGQEIWYTGIESRGQAGVVGDTGNIPLPWLIDLMCAQIGLVDEIQPILLKVLDPLADEIYGDLYFELHQEKQEVYVVTHIDPNAWPGGVGSIQLGFAAQAQQLSKTDDEFKQAYLNAVKEYEQVRRLIDCLIDEKKVAAGINVNQPVSSLQLRKWMSELSQQDVNKNLIDRESCLRQIMNNFVAHHPLVVGDVVTVPKLVPHALQHGVRVVEFQTPVYERKILSFGQKVLTQDHWDTEEAITLVDLHCVQLKSPELLSIEPSVRIEQIVNFDAFYVQRIQLDGCYLFHCDVYAVLMVLQGQLILGSAETGITVHSGQAVLLPKANKAQVMSSLESCLFLLASPH